MASLVVYADVHHHSRTRQPALSRSVAQRKHNAPEQCRGQYTDEAGHFASSALVNAHFIVHVVSSNACVPTELLKDCCVSIFRLLVSAT